MEADSDSEYETEETVILVELNGIIDSNFLFEQQSPAKILGIDSDEPVLQLGHYIFNGEYEDTSGTVAVYQPVDSPKLDDSFEEGYSYLCKTDKKLSMKRIFVQEKGEGSLKTSEAPLKEIMIPNGTVNGHADDVIINPASMAGLESIEVEANAEVSVNCVEEIILSTSNGVSADGSVPKTSDQVLEDSNLSETDQCKECGSPLNEDQVKSNNPSQNPQKLSLKRKIQDGEGGTGSPSRNTEPKKMKAIGDKSEFQNKMECSSASAGNSEVNNQGLNTMESSESICSSSAKGHKKVKPIKQNEPSDSKIDMNPSCSGNASTSEVVNMDIKDSEQLDNSEFITQTDSNQLVESSTDKMIVSIPLSNQSAPRDDNCSSSGDSGGHKVSPSHNLDPCQSSDSKSDAAHGDKMGNATASSSQVVKVGEPEVNSPGVSHEIKSTSCEVSQSLKEDGESPMHDDSDLKGNECEAYSSNNMLYGSTPSVSTENSGAANIGTSSANQILDVTASGSRKLSSCEVSQSNNSETEYLRSKDTVGECDVFIESPALANENALHSSGSVFEAPVVGADDVDCARYSQTSEGSTSEISQSHRSVISEGKYVEQVPSNAGDVCSQSSDKSQNTGSLSESKDVCVSSCDITGHSSEHSVSEERARVHPSCEVSQSDESDENAMAYAHPGSSKNEAEILNECADSDILVGEEFEIESREIECIDGAQEATIDTNTQNSCEVTQSFCSEANYVENLQNDDKSSSNECGIYEESVSAIEASGGTSNNSCVSSDEIGEFSGSALMGIENPVEQDSRCEVSQSFSPAPKSVEVEESCASSDAETKYDDPNCSFIDETECQNYGEVSQSLEPESAFIVLESDEDEDMNECNQDEIIIVSEIPPSNSTFEICESSDAIHTEEANSELASQQLGAGCEVSQSDRLEESSLDPRIQLAVAVEIEGSNECEVAGSLSIQESNLIYCIPGENLVCESSDDVDNVSEVQNESINNFVSLDVCQSSKTEGIQLSAGGNNSIENSPNESIGVCESSEDVQMQDAVNIRTDSDACTSSERSGVEQLQDNSCDSFSRQNLPGSSSRTFSQEDNNKVSQSQSDSKQSEVYVVAPSSSEQSVIVSSSGDTRSSDGTDVIYSSPNTSNSHIASNVEVTQSSYSLPHVSSNVNLLPSELASVSGHLRYEELNPDEQHLEIEECCVRSLVETSHNVIYEPVDIVHTLSNDAYISSDNSNNPLVESSTLNSSLNPEEQRIGSPSFSEQANLDKNISGNEASTSQTYAEDIKRESVILENRKTVSTSRPSSGDASHSSQPQQQVPTLVQGTSRSDNPNSRSRPSLLEVIVSSASDFRNSLMCDPNSFKDRNQVSSISESTSIIDSASGSREGTDVNPSIPSGSSSFPSQNYESTDTEVSGSLEPDPNYPRNETISYLHRVSQSSDVVNTHSSTSNIHSQLTEGIGDSSQLDIVQSSSTSSKSIAYFAPNGSSDMSEQVSSAEGSSNLPRFKVSDSGEVSESTCAQISMATCSGNSMLSSIDTIEIIESSDDLPIFHESDASNFTYEGEVSSAPLVMQNAHLQLLSADGSEQCSIIEGNVMLLSTDDSPDPSYEGSNVNVSSANSGAVHFPPNDEVADATNEAETLNRSSTSSPPPRRPDPNEQLPLSSADVPTESVETNASDSPSSILEVVSEAYDCDGSSEVSESLAAEQSDVTQSSLTDSKVSCSAVEFTLNDQSMNRNYFNDSEFPNISREAESKSSDDCISYGNVCDDTVLQSQNIPSSANNELSMYSYEGEYDDSIQSSSLEAVQESISEQIKAQNYSNSSNDEGQASGSVDPYVPIVSESQSLSPVASVPNVDVSSSFPSSQSHELPETVSGAISSSEDSSNGLEISDFSADPQMVSHVITDSSTLQECLESSNINEFSLQPADEEPSEHLEVETSDLFESADVPFHDEEKSR